MTHPLETATTYQLALMVDTLLAERHILQLNASLASHMAGAEGAMQMWIEARRDEVDANIADLAQLAAAVSDGSEDARADVDRIYNAADHVLRDRRSPAASIYDLISAHQAARALDPDSDEAGAALSTAEKALFAFRPATMEQAGARAEYLLSDEALDLSCWDTSDLRAFLGSMARR